MSKKIEIEFRSRFSKTEYKRLNRFLNKYAEDLGEDNKDVYFFILPNRMLKVVDNVSKNNAHLVVKLNRLDKGSHFEELEMPIDRRHTKLAVNILKALGFNKVMRSFQKRHNYEYKGVEISLKWSGVWGYHAELEVMVSRLSDKKSAVVKIESVARELGVNLMSGKELKQFVSGVMKKRF